MTDDDVADLKGEHAPTAYRRKAYAMLRMAHDLPMPRVLGVAIASCEPNQMTTRMSEFYVSVMEADGATYDEARKTLLKQILWTSKSSNIPGFYTWLLELVPKYMFDEEE